jgi:hypothetical protein
LLFFALPAILSAPWWAGACQTERRARSPATEATARASPADNEDKDCKRVCWRTFGQCTREVLTVTARVSPAQLARYEEAGLLAAYRTAGYQRCMQMCGREGRRARDDSLIRSCLGLSSCEAFAACIRPENAPPGATSGNPTPR